MNTRFCSPGRILPYLFYFSLLYFLLWCWKPARAQRIAGFKPLQIGDTVPDVTINNILHYKTKAAKFSDFKGKLLILDFWATWCSPCVAMIPRMDSLQKQFEGRVQFMPVAYQTENEVAVFNQKYDKRKGRRIAVPEVVGDSVLHFLFPHTYLPHYVWIGGDGIVKAVTDMHQINSANIESLLAQQQFVLEEKKDETPVPYNCEKPFLINGNGGAGENLVFHSAFTGYTQGLGNGYFLTRHKEDNFLTSKITVRNIPLPQIYCIALGEGKIYIGKNRMLIETKDSLELTGLQYGSGKQYHNWQQGNTFCYEIITPRYLNKDIYKIMQQDLDRLVTGYSAAMELRETKYYALVRTSEKDLIKTSGRQKVSSFDGTGCTLTNQPLTELFGQLNVIYLQNLPYPFLDNTGYTGNVDMEIQASMSSIESLNLALAKYDLKIAEQVGEVPMLVIRDR
jgi:thiol-disulfide isomerase/thioredoxin